jgi:predicted SAM-dependent methyltransferase
MSETRLIRPDVVKFCSGKGIDLGCGGDKITPDTWGFDQPQPYTSVGHDVIELRGDARHLPFNDNVLDYVYSSHLLEDFPNTVEVMQEWLRVIKHGGYLIIYCPDEQIYRKHCQETGQDYNLAHTIDYMSLDYMKHMVEGMPVEIVKEIGLINIYSFLIVLRKI